MHFLCISDFEKDSKMNIFNKSKKIIIKLDVVGGFVVTDRMLEMFSKKKK